MVKEFEMKKAAAAYNRSWSSKSGELDMSKIHLFKLKDDIFNRVEIIPEGKNHGVVMILDWSGSMQWFSSSDYRTSFSYFQCSVEDFQSLSDYSLLVMVMTEMKIVINLDND